MEQNMKGKPGKVKKIKVIPSFQMDFKSTEVTTVVNELVETSEAVPPLTNAMERVTPDGFNGRKSSLEMDQMVTQPCKSLEDANRNRVSPSAKRSHRCRRCPDKTYLMCGLITLAFIFSLINLCLTLMILFTRGKDSCACPEKSQAQAPEKNISCEKIPVIIKNLAEIRSDVNNVKETVLQVNTNGTAHPGPPGRDGVKGERGPTGPQGIPGPAGLQGPPGPTGARGPKGSTGPSGFNGTQGLPGPQGSIGIMGLNGSQGPPGPPGPKGPRGPSGYNASQSSGGVSGSRGPRGPPGRPGPGNLTLCQYKHKKEPAQTAGKSADSVVILREDEHKGWKVVGATCSSEGAAEYMFRDALVESSTNTIVYSCHCKGQSGLFLLGNKMVHQYGGESSASVQIEVYTRSACNGRTISHMWGKFNKGKV